MLLVLTGVTAISVALLAYVNELTKGPIAEANAKTLNEALKEVLPEFTNNPVAECDTMFSEKDGKKIVDFIIYPAKNGDQWVGTAVEAKSMGFGGELKVLVVLMPKAISITIHCCHMPRLPGLVQKRPIGLRKAIKVVLKE